LNYVIVENREIKKKDLEFFNIQNKLISLFEKENYEEGHKIILEMIKTFPEEPTITYSWASFLPYYSGNLEKALNLLEEGFSKGAWWSKSSLEGDYEKLQKFPRFQKLIDLSEEKRDSILSKESPNLFVRLPDSYSKHRKYPLILSLHGRSSNGINSDILWHDLVNQREIIVASLQSSQETSKSHFDWDNREKSIEDLRKCLNFLKEKYSIDNSQVIVAGVSQGIDVGLISYFAKEIVASGFIGIIPSVYYFDNEFIEKGKIQHIEDKIRVCFIVGEEDPRYQRTEKVTKVLRKKGAKIKIISCSETGHYYPENYNSLILEAVDFVL